MQHLETCFTLTAEAGRFFLSTDVQEMKFSCYQESSVIRG